MFCRILVSSLLLVGALCDFGVITKIDVVVPLEGSVTVRSPGYPETFDKGGLEYNIVGPVGRGLQLDLEVFYLNPTDLPGDSLAVEDKYANILGTFSTGFDSVRTIRAATNKLRASTTVNHAFGAANIALEFVVRSLNDD